MANQDKAGRHLLVFYEANKVHFKGLEKERNLP